MIEVTLLGTGSPMADPNRAGPSTLVRAGGQTFLVDCGRGTLMRAAAVGVGAANISALLLTHLHSDHITDLSDVITTRWVTTFTRTPLRVIGPPGTAAVVDATLDALAPDISYRIGHHPDITEPPTVEVEEVTEGVVWAGDGVRITVAADRSPTSRADYRIPGRIRGSIGGTCRRHRAVREPRRTGRRRGCLGAHRDPQGSRRTDACATHQRHHRLPLVGRAGRGHRRAGRCGILILTHYVPGIAPGQEDDWRAMAATPSAGRSNSATTCTGSRCTPGCADARGPG